MKNLSTKPALVSARFFQQIALIAATAMVLPLTARAASFILNSGIVGGDNYSVQAYGGAASVSPTFNGTGNGFLTSPGNGYQTLVVTEGNFQSDNGGINAPAGNLAAGLSTSATAATMSNSLFGTGNVSFSADNSGIHWNSFSQTDSAADTHFSVGNSRGIASCAVTGSSQAGQAGIVFGIRGFLPIGAQGFAGLVATFTLRDGASNVLQKAEDAVIIYAQNNGTGLPNGVHNYSIPVTGGVAEGVAANSTTSFSSSVDGSGNYAFTAYGVALLPSIIFAAGDTLSIDASMSLATDPMGSFDLFELQPFPFPGLDLPVLGVGTPARAPGTAVPLPSAALSGLLLLAVTGIRRVRRPN